VGAAREDWDDDAFRRFAAERLEGATADSREAILAALR
jgi:hypothetical protein